jgi:hypothetical protein
MVSRYRVDSSRPLDVIVGQLLAIVESAKAAP